MTSILESALEIIDIDRENLKTSEKLRELTVLKMALEIIDIDREILKTSEKLRELTVLKMALDKRRNIDEKTSGIATINRLARGGY